MDKVTQVKKHLRLEQWKKLISECQNSGMPVRAWCIQNGVKEQSYYYYLKKIREQAIKDLPVPMKEEKPVVFQKLEVQPPIQNTKAAVIIRLPNAVLEINEGASQQTVQAVLLALQNVCQATSLLSRTSTLPVATQICASLSMVLPSLYRNSSSWILFLKAFSCSVENAGTGSNAFYGKVTVFCSYTSVWKTAVSNGHAKKVK